MKAVLTGAVLIMVASGTARADNGCNSELAQRVFARCAICHSADAGAGHGVGPNLHGTLGRDIASHTDFYYSEALLAVEGSWTSSRLHDFLTNPADFAPGTTMGFGGLNSERERAAIICQLAAGSETQ